MPTSEAPTTAPKPKKAGDTDQRGIAQHTGIVSATTWRRGLMSRTCGSHGDLRTPVRSGHPRDKQRLGVLGHSLATNRP